MIGRQGNHHVSARLGGGARRTKTHVVPCVLSHHRGAEDFRGCSNLPSAGQLACCIETGNERLIFCEIVQDLSLWEFFIFISIRSYSVILVTQLKRQYTGGFSRWRHSCCPSVSSVVPHVGLYLRPLTSHFRAY